MADVITIEASQLTIGRILARGSPGVTVYEADLKLAGRTTKVGPECVQREQLL